jgi:hypothetical protein
MYYCSGFQGQMAIIPSLDWLLFVWVFKEDPEFDFNGMLSGIIGSLKK